MFSQPRPGSKAELRVDLQGTSRRCARDLSECRKVALSPALLGVTVPSAWGTFIGSFAVEPPGDRHRRRACLTAMGTVYLESMSGAALARTPSEGFPLWR